MTGARKCHRAPRPTCGSPGCQQRGLGYVELLVTVVVIAILAVPTADAIRTAVLTSEQVSTDRQRRNSARSVLELALSGNYQAEEEALNFFRSFTINLRLADGATLTLRISGYDIDNADGDNDIATGLDDGVYLYTTEIAGTSIAYQGIRYDQ